MHSCMHVDLCACVHVCLRSCVQACAWNLRRILSIALASSPVASLLAGLLSALGSPAHDAIIRASSSAFCCSAAGRSFSSASFASSASFFASINAASAARFLRASSSAARILLASSAAPSLSAASLLARSSSASFCRRSACSRCDAMPFAFLCASSPATKSRHSARLIDESPSESSASNSTSSSPSDLVSTPSTDARDSCSRSAFFRSALVT